MELKLTDKVVINRCESYDIAKVEAVIRAQLASIGAGDAFFAGKKVVIKPNLVIPVPPERCITTHPFLVEAAARIIAGAGARVVIAESPGGPYTEAMMNISFRITGIKEAARRAGVPLNTDMTSRPFNAPRAVTSHYFDVISPVIDADIIVNMPKLKTHSLTVLSAAVKNLFGVVPGLTKAQTHARYKDRIVFQSALVDLAAALFETKTIISIVDAVDGMEGNGPSGGDPRQIGCILTGADPFSVDLVCAEIIGVSGQVEMLRQACERGLCPPSADPVAVNGDNTEMFKISNFKKPDTHRADKFDFLPNFFSPVPRVIPKKCIGCGKCLESCPEKTILIRRTRKGSKAKITVKNCIRCFCCQEMCPVKAIKIKKFFIFKLLS